ncbi:MAG: MAPEG family protein [Sphingomonadaceae bacterium]|jgi:hypothetical protein
MPEEEMIAQAYIFVPMLAVVVLTFVAFIGMAAARGKAAKEVEPGFYKAHIGAGEPEYAKAKVRHFNIMFELPVLFYAACITAFVLAEVGPWTVRFAWAFVAFRVVQSVIHLTYNNPAHRGIAFVLSMLAMIALWVNVGMAIFASI